MLLLDRIFNWITTPFAGVAHWTLRLGLGWIFLSQGLSKFPIEGFAMMMGSRELATAIAVTEVAAGGVILFSGLLRGPAGAVLTRLAAGAMIAIMVGAYLLIHQADPLDKLGLQMLLFLGACYMAIRGNDA